MTPKQEVDCYNLQGQFVPLVLVCLKPVLIGTSQESNKLF